MTLSVSGRLNWSRSLGIGLDRQKSLHVQFAMAPAGVPADAGMAVLSNGLEEPPLGLAPVDAPIFFGVVRLETATFVSLAVVSSAVSFPRGEPWQWTRRRR